MENIPVTETGKAKIARDVSGLGLRSGTKLQVEYGTNVIHHKPNYGSESVIYSDSGSESDKCLDSDVCPRVDVESSWETWRILDSDRVPVKRMACMIHHEPNYGSESDKCPDSGSESDQCPDSDVCPRVDIGESWKTGLFDCHKDKAIAAVVMFCPCVAFGHIAEILDEGEMTCPMGTFSYLLMMPLLCSQWIIGSKYRKKLRRKLNLVEAPYEDWASHVFCHYCSLCQEYRELQIRGLDPSLGWKGIHARQQGMQQLQRSQDLVQCPPRTHAMSK